MVHQSSRTSVAAVGLLALFVPNAHGQTNVPAGLIDTDTVWSATGSPYLLEGNILVAPGTTLTIEPGVQVHFLDTQLTISGRLIARGTASDGISLFADRDQDRGGVHFLSEASDGSVLSYCSFEFMTLDAQRVFPLVEFCSFGRSTSVKKIEAFDFQSPNVTIRDCNFSDTANASFVDLDTFVFERNIGLRELNVFRVSDIHIRNNTISRPNFQGAFLWVTGPHASITGVISGNVFVGDDVVIDGFIGLVSQNMFSIDQLRLDGTGGTWLRNDFTFEYGVATDFGIRISNVPGFMAFYDNNFAPFPDAVDSQRIISVTASFGSVIDAEMNWWSTVDAVLIEAAIYHSVDRVSPGFMAANDALRKSKAAVSLAMMNVWAFK